MGLCCFSHIVSRECGPRDFYLPTVRTCSVGKTMETSGKRSLGVCNSMRLVMAGARLLFMSVISNLFVVFFKFHGHFYMLNL